MFTGKLIEKSKLLIEECQSLSLTIGTAESCTGGLLSACLTEIPGSSNIFQGGFVTYSNDAKITTLNVSAELIEKVGAVSKEVACAMAIGALNRAETDLAVSITGVAGPDGGTNLKPVGLVHFGVATKHVASYHERHVFPGDRYNVRMQAVEMALVLLLRSTAGYTESKRPISF